MRAARPQPARSGAVPSSESGLAAGEPLSERDEITGRDHPQRIDTASVGTSDAKFKAGNICGLTAPRQPTELCHQQAGGGVEALFLGQVGAEVLVEFVDARNTPHRVLPIRILADVE